MRYEAEVTWSDDITMTGRYIAGLSRATTVREATEAVLDYADDEAPAGTGGDGA